MPGSSPGMTKEFEAGAGALRQLIQRRLHGPLECADIAALTRLARAAGAIGTGASVVVGGGVLLDVDHTEW